MCGSCGRRSRPIPSVRTTWSPKPALAIACAHRTERRDRRAAMEIKDFLAPLHVVIDLRASDKKRLLEELARRAAAAVGLGAESIASALSKREALGSTGTGGGVAVPHARLAGLGRPFGLLARLTKPVDFDAIDGQPVDLVF